MNEGTAIELIKGKMRELKIARENYIIRFRHFRLDPKEIRRLKADNEYYIFIYPYFNISVESKTGRYDMKDTGINELQHIHSGYITIVNQSNIRLDAKFIQAIPLAND